MRHSQLRTVTPLVLALACALLASASLAQQAGHATVPAAGAAAPGPFPTAERETDPVLAKIETLRRALGDLGKEYKKGKRDERVRGEVLKGLDRVDGEIGATRELLGKR